MELGECTWDALGVIVLDYEYSLTSKYIQSSEKLPYPSNIWGEKTRQEWRC